MDLALPYEDALVYETILTSEFNSKPISAFFYNCELDDYLEPEIRESNIDETIAEEQSYNQVDEEVTDTIPKRKAIGPPCNCRLGCYNKISEETRNQLHKAFWNDCSWEQRKQYVALSITESPKSRSRCRGPLRTERRHLTCTYTLLVNDELIKVCKGMFLNTLSVSEKFVRLVMGKKRSSLNGVAGADFKEKQKKKSLAVKEMIREHIKSFPSETLPGDQSGKRYLDASLNVSAMHKLYVKLCHEKGLPERDIVRQGYYREIFKSEFDLAFKNKEQ